MADILNGRWSARVAGDFVVFLIGAQVRNPLRAARAIPLLAQMRHMLADLENDREAAADSGFLGFESHGVGPLGVIVQYWRSFEDLERFARSPGGRHAAVWRKWNRAAQHKNGAVGIWHEAYGVTGGRYEAIYQNMPAIGLLKAGSAEPSSGSQSARARRAANGGQDPAAVAPALPSPAGPSERDPV